MSRDFDLLWAGCEAAMEGDLAYGDMTEIMKLVPDRVDGVAMPATGEGWLLMKSAASEAERVLGRMGFATGALPPLPERAELRPRPGVMTRLVKSDAERRYTLCLAYPCDRPDRAQAADGFRDVAGPDAIEQGAWDFMSKGRKVGLFHADGTEGAGEVVESYIWRAPPHVFKGADGTGRRVHAGDWLVGIKWSPEAWAMLKANPPKITGISMQGDAARGRPSPETLARVRARRAGE